MHVLQMFQKKKRSFSFLSKDKDIFIKDKQLFHCYLVSAIRENCLQLIVNNCIAKIEINCFSTNSPNYRKQQFYLVETRLSTLRFWKTNQSKGQGNVGSKWP